RGEHRPAEEGEEWIERFHERLESKGSLVTRLEEGDVFGEEGLLDCEARARATLVARVPTQVYQLSQDDFMTISALFGNELRERLQSHLQASTYEVCKFLATKSLLMKDGPVDLIRAASKRVKSVMAKPNEVIIDAGSTNRGVFLVVEGEVHCFVKASDGVTKLAVAFTPGDFFGDLPLLAVQGAELITTSPSHLLHLPTSDVSKLCKAHPFLRQSLSSRRSQYEMLSFLFQLPLLAGCSYETLHALLGSLEIRTAIAGQLVQREEEQCDQLCFVADGSMLSTTRRPKTSSILARGQHFGEEVIYGAKTKRDVQAVTDCTLYTLGVEGVVDLVSLFPGIVSTVKQLEREEEMKLRGAPAEEGYASPSVGDGADGEEKFSSCKQFEQRIGLVQLSLSQMGRELAGKANLLESRLEEVEESVGKKLDALLAELHAPTREATRGGVRAPSCQLELI
ncbi:MAG: hypothetical protein SGPRY_007800, partial [Prymnesium sp.]